MWYWWEIFLIIQWEEQNLREPHLLFTDPYYSNQTDFWVLGAKSIVSEDLAPPHMISSQSVAYGVIDASRCIHNFRLIKVISGAHCTRGIWMRENSSTAMVDMNLLPHSGKEGISFEKVRSTLLQRRSRWQIESWWVKWVRQYHQWEVIMSFLRTSLHLGKIWSITVEKVNPSRCNLITRRSRAVPPSTPLMSCCTLSLHNLHNRRFSIIMNVPTLQLQEDRICLCKQFSIVPFYLCIMRKTPQSIEIASGSCESDLLLVRDIRIANYLWPPVVPMMMMVS
jgi:hypothetical protein